jgi:hypothetical protein
MDGLVTAPGLRDLMNQILLGDSELDAFVIDHFPQVQRLYAGSMDRIAKVNLLFERVSFDQIYASLCTRYPNAASNGATSSRTNGTGHPVIAQTFPGKVAATGECAVRYFLVLTGTIDEVDEPKLRALVSHIRKLSGDADLTLEAIKSGSIILHFRGTAAGLERLREAFQSGQLREIIGYPLERIKEDQDGDNVQLGCLPRTAEEEDDSSVSAVSEQSPKNRCCLRADVLFERVPQRKSSMSKHEGVWPRPWPEQQASRELSVNGTELEYLAHRSGEPVPVSLVEKSSFGSAQLVPVPRVGWRRSATLLIVGLLILAAVGDGKFWFPAAVKVDKKHLRAPDLNGGVEVDIFQQVQVDEDHLRAPDPYSTSELQRAWRIRSLPRDVDVREAVTGRMLGQTPLIFRGPLSSRTALTLSRPGYEERHLTLSYDDLAIVTVKMRRSKL